MSRLPRHCRPVGGAFNPVDFQQRLLWVIFDSFGTECGMVDARSCPKGAYQCLPMSVAFGRMAVIQTSELELESCATNSLTMNGPLSSRCCRTSRVASPGRTTDGSSSGSFDQEHPGVICRRRLGHTPLATTASSGGGGLASGAASIKALATAHDAATQMIDTSIVSVHQHGACIARNQPIDGKVPRRFDEQNPCGGRQQWSAGTVGAEPR
jgi:hypothetical protein